MPIATPAERSTRRSALLQALEGALPCDEDGRRHWMVTIAFCAQAAGDEELSAAQRDAYREFRGRVAGWLSSAASPTDSQAITVAEQLIAVADGIAVQALFDPSSWPADRQLATLHSTIEPLLA